MARATTEILGSYNVADLGQLLGQDARRVRRLIKRGLFGKRVAAGAPIRESRVRRFLLTHDAAYDLCRVDQGWLKAMLFGSVGGCSFRLNRLNHPSGRPSGAGFANGRSASMVGSDWRLNA